MGRFSPTVLPDSGPDFQTSLARLLQLQRQQKLDEVSAEERDRRRELQEVELHSRGFRRMDKPPTTERRNEPPPAFRDERLGMARGTGEPRGDMFEGRGLGMQPDRAQPGQESVLAEALQAGARGGGDSRPLLLPGQFSRELGGFTEAAVYATPQPGPRDPASGRIHPSATPDFNPDAARQRNREQFMTREVADPRFERVGETDIYFDREQNPDAMRRAQQAEERSLLAQALARHPEIDDLEAQVLATGQRIPDRILFDEEEEGITPEELVAAGIPENIAPIAARDPVLARRLLEETLSPEEGPSIRVAGRTFPDTPQGRQDALEWERQTSAAGRAPRTGAGAEENPAFVERRKAIVDAAGRGPVNRVEQIAIDQAASGQSLEQILADMRRFGAPEEDIERVRTYLEFALGG